MRQRVILTVISFLLGLRAVEAWKLNSRQLPDRRAPQHVPFTAHATQVAVGPEGSVPLTITKIIALRQDGSYYESQTNLNHLRNKSITARTIWDKASGTKTVILPDAQATVSYGGKSGRLPSLGCTEQILAYPEAGEYLGFAVVEKTREVPVEGGLNQTRSLYAPALNCLLMLDEGRMIDADGRTVAKSNFQVNSVTLREPDPAFFKIPSDYAELPPSGAWTRALDVVDPETAAAVRDVHGEHFAKADAEYSAGRASNR